MSVFEVKLVTLYALSKTLWKQFRRSKKGEAEKSSEGFHDELEGCERNNSASPNHHPTAIVSWVLEADGIHCLGEKCPDRRPLTSPLNPLHHY